MEIPTTRLVRALEHRMATNAARAVQGIAAEIGTITKVFLGEDAYTVKRVWLKLDNFKDTIKDAMFSDFKVKMVMKDFARVVRLVSPVNPDGTDGDGAEYSDLTRFDFEVQGVADAEGAKRKEITVEVELRTKDGLKVGDRVLVATFNRGQDHLIVCKVKPPCGEGCGGCGGCDG